MRQVVFLIFIFFLSLVSCETEPEKYEIMTEFFALDIFDDGKCNPPYLIVITGNTYIYTNHLRGVFDKTMPPFETYTFFRGNKCRFYISKYDFSFGQVDIHVMHLLNGREAHFQGKMNSMTLIKRDEIPECPHFISKDNLDQLERCGNAIAQKSSLILSLEEPTEPFDWHSELIEVFPYNCEMLAE